MVLNDLNDPASPAAHRSRRHQGPLADARLLRAVLLNCLWCLSVTTAQAQAPEAGQLQLARYTTAAPLPDPARLQPLVVVAMVHFPRATVTTVGDALRHLLARTGYALADDALDTPARALMSLPLPESHRVLGPYRVEDMVQVLLGQPWALSVDHLQRQLRFAAAAGSASFGAPTAAAGPSSNLAQVKP